MKPFPDFAKLGFDDVPVNAHCPRRKSPLGHARRHPQHALYTAEDLTGVTHLADAIQASARTWRHMRERRACESLGGRPSESRR